MSVTDLDLYTVRADATLEDAMTVIESNNHRSAVVLDDKDRVVGTLSDGDIRKAMLRHRLLVTPVRDVMNMNFVWLSPAETGKAPELFGKYHIFLIPVLDDDSRLTGLLAAY